MAALTLASSVNLPPAIVGVPYDVGVTFTGMTSTVGAPVKFAAGTGAGNGLPAGLVFDATTARITGTPKQFTASTPTGAGVALKGTGTYTVRVTATNGTDTLAEQSIFVTVVADWAAFGAFVSPYPYSVAAELAVEWPQS